MSMRIYMDHNATTPLHPEVEEELKSNFGLYGNPSSMHSFGREARRKIEDAREKVAKLIDADVASIIFTGGGSESNNTVLKVVTCSDATCVHCPANRKQIITSTIEHPSVLNTVQTLDARGIPATYIDVDKTGTVDLDRLESAVSERSALVSVMMANNEMNETQLIFFGPEKPPEELYDLENDPHEIHNLAEDSAFQKELEEHRTMLKDWIAETGDQGQATESDAGLLATLKRWGDKCVNPEYDRVRSQLKESKE